MQIYNRYFWLEGEHSGEMSHDLLCALNIYFLPPGVRIMTRDYLEYYGNE